MSLYEGPRDVTQHLKQLETKYGLGQTLHGPQQYHGWRAERDWIQREETYCQRPAEKSGRAIAAKVGKRLLGWTRPFGKSI